MPDLSLKSEFKKDMSKRQHCSIMLNKMDLLSESREQGNSWGGGGDVCDTTGGHPCLLHPAQKSPWFRELCFPSSCICQTFLLLLKGQVFVIKNLSFTIMSFASLFQNPAFPLAEFSISYYPGGSGWLLRSPLGFGNNLQQQRRIWPSWDVTGHMVAWVLHKLVSLCQKGMSSCHWVEAKVPAWDFSSVRKLILNHTLNSTHHHHYSSKAKLSCFNLWSCV